MASTVIERAVGVVMASLKSKMVKGKQLKVSVPPGTQKVKVKASFKGNT